MISFIFQTSSILLPVKKLCTVATQTDDLGCANGCTSMYINSRSNKISSDTKEQRKRCSSGAAKVFVEANKIDVQPSSSYASNLTAKINSEKDERCGHFTSGAAKISVEANKIDVQPSSSYADDLTAVLQVLNEADDSNPSHTTARDLGVNNGKNKVDSGKNGSNTTAESHSFEVQLKESGVNFHKIESISVCNSKAQNHESQSGKCKRKKTKEIAKSPNFVFVGYNNLSTSSAQSNVSSKRPKDGTQFSMVLDKIPISENKTSQLTVKEQVDIKKTFTCKICHKVLDMREYDKHTQMHKKVVCTQCGIDFNSEAQLNRHLSFGHKSMIFQCSICSKAFECKSYLLRHTLTHSEVKPFKCPTCDKTFRAKCSLSKHIKTKHTEGEERSFKCIECGRGFWCNFTYKRHLLIHTGQKPYKCSVCGRAFRQDNHLKEHFKRKHSAGLQK